MATRKEDDSESCCGTYCTTLQICCLRVMRPGDTVPFYQNSKLLPLTIAQVICAIILSVFGLLAIFCQYKELTSPAPSFLGMPGTILWTSLCIVLCGICGICGYKRKDRFMSAVSFACSILASIFTIALLGLLTVCIAQEVEYYRVEKKVMGVIIASMIMTFVVVEMILTVSSALLQYMTLSSHDDRWFTDRGTQHVAEQACPSSSLPASVSVPSGQPAFLFYAPQKDSVKIANALQDALCSTDHSDERGTSPMDENFTF